jgi:hypothetical protein
VSVRPGDRRGKVLEWLLQTAAPATNNKTRTNCRKKVGQVKREDEREIKLLDRVLVGETETTVHFVCVLYASDGCSCASHLRGLQI